MTHIHIFDELNRHCLTDTDTLHVGLRALSVPRPSRWRLLTSLLWRLQARCALPMNALAIRISRAQLVGMIGERHATRGDARRVQRLERLIVEWEQRLAHLRARRVWLRQHAGIGR